MLLSTIIFGLYSCSKEIQIDLGEYEKKIVIEGYIENGEYPWCVLTYNQDYFGEINISMDDLSKLSDIFIMDATVIVSDGFIDDTLEFEMDPLVLQGKFIWPPVHYKGSKIIGETGRSYSLKVVYKDEEYTATTSIPSLYDIDTCWFQLDPMAQNDSLGSIWTVIRDNPNEVNYYRYYTKRVGRDNYYAPGQMSIWDDRFFNGKDFEFVLFRGRSLEIDYGAEDPESGYFKLGDTVSIKACTMDRDTFWFWYTLGNQQTLSNIQGGALGVWCGYGATYKTLLCKLNEEI
jgi:hypothetical protein